LPPRPQRLPPLRAFHLSASRSQPARAEILNFEFYTLFWYFCIKTKVRTDLSRPKKS
jgi:hypothetical protein